MQTPHHESPPPSLPGGSPPPTFPAVCNLGAALQRGPPPSSFPASQSIARFPPGGVAEWGEARRENPAAALCKASSPLSYWTARSPPSPPPPLPRGGGGGSTGPFIGSPLGRAASFPASLPAWSFRVLQSPPSPPRLAFGDLARGCHFPSSSSSSSVQGPDPPPPARPPSPLPRRVQLE